MNLITRQVQANGLLAIVSVHGEVDASNYQELVTKARELQEEGVEKILIDLSETTFLSSSGLVAIHRVALLMGGSPTSDSEQGWAAIRAVENAAGSGRQQRVKLLNPRANVARTLATAGLNQFFEIHSDLEAALSSF